jgi:hypothetical protein
MFKFFTMKLSLDALKTISVLVSAETLSKITGGSKSGCHPEPEIDPVTKMYVYPPQG